ncbi:hypothetical protein Q3G72_027958 [Acer saccharum]|nr:hypothetical protein Q3G72_027958 [Acer saccharum]
MVASACKLSGGFSVAEVEALAVLKGIEMVVDIGLVRAVLETNIASKIRMKTDVKVYENQREAEAAEANAELAKKKTGWAKEAQVAEVESVKAVALREA